MYKILLVDDEPEVREGIRESIQWDTHGFELVGDCTNGQEALEAIERLRPDVVLSDIYMPFMDGLELTKHVSERYPFTKMIILTGYDSFEYAQQALRLKAYDFILKPITAMELRKLLDKVRQDMDEEKKIREDYTKLQQLLDQSLPLLKERFLERLVTSFLSINEIRERSEYFQITWPTSNYIVMVMDIDDFGSYYSESDLLKDAELLRFACYNIIGDLMDYYTGITFRTREERMAVILCGDQENQLYENAYKLADEIRQCIERYLKFTVTIGVGRVCASLDQLPLSYEGAVSALDYRFLLGKNRIVSIVEMEGTGPEGKPVPELNMDWSRKLASAVKAGILSEAEAQIEQLMRVWKESMMPIEACYLNLQKIVVVLMNVVQEMGGNEITLFTERGIVLADSYRFKTLDEIEHWVKGIIKLVVQFATEQRSDLTKLQVMRAVEYIEANYHSEEISLQHLCRHVLMSTSYFSMIFKQHTGDTFVEYLTRVRIEKAGELLQETQLKSYEIAAKVGVADPHYFSVLFKKHTGMTPTEYREKVARERQQ
ncbi:response regulator [Paenibacillus eucommiae]|uniref:Two-component system response regulator YesN n=1 Tax=Paenibacillus eucommiae TaxID=1355755 RepID=A0ABS4ILK4_9BACL|nr:response regulator [Paenibacillus eucommiae]MBP1988443.1 two-component system response regulator YesN [Paenibacillus eucommiae]